MEPPTGLFAVPMPEAFLLLTHAEYFQGRKRGQSWRRTQSTIKRETNALTLKTPRASRKHSILVGACSPTGDSGTGTRPRAGGSR
jgi:hypothetical protein